MLIIEIEKRHNKMVDRIRYPTVSYLPFYYVLFQFLLLTIFNLQANILTTKDILSNLAFIQFIQKTRSFRNNNNKDNKEEDNNNKEEDNNNKEEDNNNKEEDKELIEAVDWPIPRVPGWSTMADTPSASWQMIGYRV